MKIFNYSQNNKNQLGINGLCFFHRINSSQFGSCLIGSLLLILLLSSTCREESLHYNITFKNNSSNTVCAVPSQSYPDTTLDCKVVFHYVSAGHEFQLSDRDGWEHDFKRKSVLQIFVVDSSIWKKEPCDTIRKYNKLLKRYQLTLDDVELMNWTITYP
jgi:hypothetical protein